MALTGLNRLCLLVLLTASYSTAVIKNKGWWKNAVIYQIYPLSFMDSNNDGSGDLKGITSKLQHFVESGITAVWLSPIFESPMVDFGYDISNFTSINPIFGTMQDFEELTSQAKKLGIKVLIDLVPNHTSDKHEWFQMSLAGVSRYKDYYVWRPGKNNSAIVPPNNWISVFTGPAWTYAPTRKSWYYHQFDRRQPDLNYNNPDVRAEMENVIKFWLRKGVDGFRIDAVPHIYESDHLMDEPRSFTPNTTEREYAYLEHIYTKDDQRTYELIRSWRKVLDDYANAYNLDEKVIMTEAYASLDNMTKYYRYGSNVPFNFQILSNVNNRSVATAYKDAIDSWMLRTPVDASANWVMGNHDGSRVASRYPNRADQMTMLAMILPGVAVTYNGEEIGMVDKDDISWEDTQDPQACNAGKDKYKNLSRDRNRTPFQWDNTTNAGFSRANRTWLPVHDNYKTLNLASQKVAKESHYKIYKTLTTLRKTSSALTQGTYKVLPLNGNLVLAVGRESSNETIVLLINFFNTISSTVNLVNKVALKKNTIVEVSSLDCPLKQGTILNPQLIKLPGRCSVVISSRN